MSLGYVHPVHLTRFIEILCARHRVGRWSISIPVLQEGKLIFREVRKLAYDHVANKWQSQREHSDDWTLCVLFTDALIDAGW